MTSVRADWFRGFLRGVMPELELKAGETKAIKRLVAFVAESAADLSVNARFALVIELFRAFRPEVDELNRRKREGE